MIRMDQRVVLLGQIAHHRDEVALIVIVQMGWRKDNL